MMSAGDDDSNLMLISLMLLRFPMLTLMLIQLIVWVWLACPVNHDTQYACIHGLQ
jgi:hypothetical protein